MLYGVLTAGCMNELPVQSNDKHCLVPFEHKGIRHNFVEEPSGWAVLVSEKLGGRHPTLTSIEDAYAMFSEFEGEIVLIEAQHNEHGFNLRCLSNGNGVAPLYCYQAGESIHFDWDINRLARTVQHKQLDFQFFCRALVNPVYSHRTPFANIQCLLSRTQLIWNGQRLEVTQLDGEDPDIEIDREDASSFICDHVGRFLKKREYADLKFAVELSGGIDSSFVALSAFRNWQTEGVTLGVDIGFGSERDAQAERRAKVVKSVGCQDYVVNIRDFLPDYVISSDDIESKYLLAEEYERAFEQIWSSARDIGCNTITGGYGGDELFPTLTSEEVRDDKLRGVTEADRAEVELAFQEILTPRAWQAINDGFIGELDAGYLATSARIAAIKRSPLLLKHGLWPVFPLFDERLAAAMLTATADERHEKHALQMAAKSLLGGHDMFGTYEKETLEQASDRALRGAIDRILPTLSSSRLIEMGILKADAISLQRVGDLSNSHNPFTSILSLLFGAEKYVRRNF